MTINGIDFPEKLLKAVNDGTLVVFAGAGVSVGKPTSLPSFTDLTARIAKIAGEQFDKEVVLEDVFLGKLESKGMEVTKIVAEELRPLKELPNQFHYSIIDLFSSVETTRIVTTNQDLMLELAAKKRKRALPVYTAPAVPYGDDFYGIVHLHGDINDHKRIIITDRGFGEAYMMNGYASRFLKEMFEKYTVLFIGYSYDDIIVRYLTTAITAKSVNDAYILSNGEPTEQLRRTGIKSIEFNKGDFGNECESIKRLGELTKRGLTDWMARINSLEMDSPPIDKETQDELLYGIKESNVQRKFCERIQGKNWADWLNEHGVFNNLFVSDATLLPSERVWASWLAKYYKDDELLYLIQTHKEINIEFCHTILIEACNTHNNYSNELFAVYVGMFHSMGIKPYVLLSLVEEAARRKMYPLMWMFFWKLCEVSIILEPWYFSSLSKSGVRCSFKWKCEDYSLRDIWKRILPKEFEDPLSILRDATITIEKMYTLFMPIKGEYKLDSVNMIDIENKNGFHENEDVLYVLVEMIEHAYKLLHASAPDKADNWLLDSINSRYVLVQRIALLLLRKNISTCAGIKLERVLQACDLHDDSLRTQLFGLIADIYDDLSTRDQRQVISAIWDANIDFSNWDDDKKQERSLYYYRFRWYQWIKDNCKSTDLIDKKILDIKKRYPDFNKEEHPDIPYYTATVKWGSESPVSVDDLLGMTSNEATDFISDFHPDPFIIGPDREGLMLSVVEAIKESFEWGIGLMGSLIGKNYWKQDIWTHVFQGLEYTTETKKQFVRVLDLLNDDVIKNAVTPLSRYINQVLQKSTLRNQLSRVLRERLYKLLVLMWNNRGLSLLDEENYINRSLNNATGLITHSLLSLIPSSEQGLPRWFTKVVETVIEKDRERYEFICVINGYAAHLFYRDQEWTRKHVFCYLNSDDSHEKTAAWEGFLSMVSNFSLNFGEEVLPYFKNETEIRKKIDKGLRNRFIYDYTLLLAYVSDNPIENYLGEFLRYASLQDRQHFAYSIGSILEKMSQEARVNIWNRWLKEYWGLRNKKVPAELDRGEYKEMLNWVLYDGIIKDGVDLIDNSNIQSLNVGSFFRKLLASELIDRFPNECADYVIKLNQYITNILEQKAITGIVERLLLLGITKDRRKQLLEIKQSYL